MKTNKAWHRIHAGFKLNGHSHSLESLWDVGYSLVKESESYEVEIGDFLLEWLSESDRVRVSTSGTTGTPKTIALSKEHMINSAMATGRFFSLSPGQKALLCLPCKYISGKMMLVRALTLGLQLDYVEPNANPLGTKDKKYDFAAMVPLQAQNSIEKITNVKTLIVGGGKLSHTLSNVLKEEPTKVFETYGMTETATHIAVRKLDNEATGYFETFPGIELTKDDRECLVIGAPRLGIQDLVTNDIVELKSDGRFRLLGRFDNVINSGGVKLVPEQIELKIGKIINNRFFVAGIPDQKLGEKLVLIIEGKVDSDAILKSLKASNDLSRFEVPKEIFNVSDFAFTESGKIQRKKTMQLLDIP